MNLTGIASTTDAKVNGVHIHVGKQADMKFLEKRRRGLHRFVNALERHPVLKSDQLVTTFLTVPTVRGILSAFELMLMISRNLVFGANRPRSLSRKNLRTDTCLPS